MHGIMGSHHPNLAVVEEKLGIITKLVTTHPKEAHA
jgi:hypothetical protein